MLLFLTIASKPSLSVVSARLACCCFISSSCLVHIEMNLVLAYNEVQWLAFIFKTDEELMRSSDSGKGRLFPRWGKCDIAVLAADWIRLWEHFMGLLTCFRWKISLQFKNYYFFLLQSIPWKECWLWLFNNVEIFVV